ncbi:MAG: hypothetical protein WCC86_02275 [Methanoregula sp.]|uniref:hypothetical protein n=1 Tax=Methanoregula sp. TaxID=2052170 RepID=UPI003BB0E02A
MPRTVMTAKQRIFFPNQETNQAAGDRVRMKSPVSPTQPDYPRDIGSLNEVPCFIGRKFYS